MNKPLFSALCFALPLAAGNPNLTKSQLVYVLPMTSSFDQYLATELTRDNVIALTTDPKQATAVMTDRLGEGLERRLDEWFPQTAPKPADKDKDKKDEAGKNAPAVRLTSFSRGKGTIFMIDTRSRRVLWSTYARPKDSTAHQLQKTADRVAARLKRDAQPEKP